MTVTKPDYVSPFAYCANEKLRLISGKSYGMSGRISTADILTAVCRCTAVTPGILARQLEIMGCPAEHAREALEELSHRDFLTKLVFSQSTLHINAYMLSNKGRSKVKSLGEIPNSAKPEKQDALKLKKLLSALEFAGNIQMPDCTLWSLPCITENVKPGFFTEKFFRPEVLLESEGASSFIISVRSHAEAFDELDESLLKIEETLSCCDTNITVKNPRVYLVAESPEHQSALEGHLTSPDKTFSFPIYLNNDYDCFHTNCAPKKV